MRRFLVRITVVALAAASLGVVGAESAHAVTTCDGPRTGTFNDNVVVPSGTFCFFKSATIGGSISVQPGGNLDTEDSTVKGSIAAGNNPFGVGIVRTTVYGQVIIDHASEGSDFICSSTLNGLSITNSTGSDPWWIGNPDGSCPGNVIKGSVTLTGNAVRVLFRNNSVGASMTAKNNTGAGSVRNSTIAGSLTVGPNNPCWTVSGNTVSGSSSVQPCT